MRDDSKPAFPYTGCGDEGMTMRDYFAAHAPDAPQAWHGAERNISDLIQWRWYYADAMLQERTK
jgi:hypothetical protein